ncbi:isochorismatase family protein family [Moniliophthora roreri]|nr:isochorismatase family protein family [Moniliophthora roreri]
MRRNTILMSAEKVPKLKQKTEWISLCNRIHVDYAAPVRKRAREGGLGSCINSIPCFTEVLQD